MKNKYKILLFLLGIFIANISYAQTGVRSTGDSKNKNSTYVVYYDNYNTYYYGYQWTPSDFYTLEVNSSVYYVVRSEFVISKNGTEVHTMSVNMDEWGKSNQSFANIPNTYTFTEEGTYTISVSLRRRSKNAGAQQWYYDLLQTTITIVRPTWTPIPNKCIDDASFNLTDYIVEPLNSQSSYSFSGNSVINGLKFSPSSGVGTKVVTLNMNGYLYNTSIEVNDYDVLTWDADAEMNNTDGEIDLSDYISHNGGAFTARITSPTTAPLPLRSGRYLDLLNVIPIDDYTTTSKDIEIVYTYTNGGCTQTITRNINILNNNVYIKYTAIPDQCANESELDIAPFFEPKGGTFKVSGNTLLGFSTVQFKSSGDTKVTYTYEKNGYTTKKDIYIRVYDLPTTTVKTLPKVCDIDKIDLTYYGEPVGGIWSGEGVESTSGTYYFNPLTAGIGEYPLTYTVTNVNGCQNSRSKDIEVISIIPSNIAWSNIPSVCQEAASIYLPDYINSTDGVFSGRGVTGDYFDPSISGGGSVNITYTITIGRCKKEYVTTLEVYSTPSVVFNTIPEVCFKDEEIKLDAYVNTSSGTGTFSGTGVKNGKFIAKDAGIGTHYVYYNYTNDNGCTTSAQQTIVVKGELPSNIAFNSIPDVCVGAAIIDLNNYINITGGVFSGTGVTGNLFDPSVAGKGIKTIKYKYTSGSCIKEVTQTISVINNTDINYIKFPTVCYTTPIHLMDYVVPKTGTFMGRGVEANIFNPEAAGLGQHAITYTYVNTFGCETVVTQTIYVDLLIDNNTVFSAIPEKCINSSSVYLRDYINSNEGSFTGTGVNGDYFNPSISGQGTFTIKWINSNGKCNNELTTVINVNDKPNVTFNNLPNICYLGEEVGLSAYVTKTGGVFSGPGVIDGKFYADQVTEGTYPISYIYTQGDCSVTLTQNIFVKGKLPIDITLRNIPNQCITGSVIDLNGYINYTGGIFSGSGVTDHYFDPSKVKAGPTTITYKYTSGSCIETLTKTVIVENNTPVTFSDIGIICTNTPYNLNNYVSPGGGTFSGPGVSSNTFTPSVAGVGTHTVYYEYANALGCATSSSMVINVDMLLGDITWTEIPDMCIYSSKIYLPDYINHTGGTFSGPGVTGEYFDPSVAGTGRYAIKYTVVGGRCTKQFTTMIQVSEGVSVDFRTIPSICFNQPINLNDYVSRTGGIFSGPGVSGSTFDPAVTGRGTFTVNYRYLSTMGCEVSVSQTISVIDLLEDVNFTTLPVMCESSEPLILDSYITNHTTGTYSGPGVTANVFNPSKSGAGIHQLKYTINNGGCFIVLTQNITVHPKVNVTFATQDDVCYNKTIELSRLVSPSGGTFSGTGITGSIFDPSVTGIGSYIIKYSYTSNNGCETVASITMNVVDLIDVDITFDALPELCAESENLYLPDFINHSGGTFSGPGVTGNYFNPAVAGTGTHMINYTVKTGSCLIQVNDVINVFSQDQIVFSTIPKVCYDTPINLNDYISPIGGEFSGSGVKNNKLYPADIGLGQYTITYEYINARGCKGKATKVVEIVDLMSGDITFSALPNVCPQGSVINLRGYVNSVEGTFKGAGITGDYFDPSIAGPGVHKILFQIINGTCKIERYNSIVVSNPPSLIFEEIGTICNTNMIDVQAYVLPKGGTFSGTGMGGTKFNPSVAGIGSHRITYMYTDSEGCINTISQNIDVEDIVPETLTFNPLPEICTNSSTLKLSDYLNIYNSKGKFTGNGVSGEYFNPSNAGEGTHYIEYTIGNKKCNKIVGQYIKVIGNSINNKFYTLPTICVNKNVNLRDYTTLDGIFQGPGVTGSTFNPSVAGIGNHAISFTYENVLGCEYILTQQIEVAGLLPINIEFNDLPDICQSSPGIDLSGYVNHTGVFTGNGIDGTFFNPSTVTPGTYKMRFSYSDGVCKGSIEKTITVYGKEEIYINSFPELCNNAVVDLNQYVTVQGGTWSGIGVNGSSGTFDPMVAGIGEKVVTYTYANKLGCKTIIQKNINVLEIIPDGITFRELPDKCVDSSPIKLTDFIDNSKEGTFIGKGVEGGYFSPNIAGAGAWVITFETGSSKLCKKQYVQTIVVHDKKVVEFTNIPVKCDNSIVQLENYVSHSGGIFTGVGVTNGVFDPSIAGIGKHKITYRYENRAGCETTVSQYINVPTIYPGVVFNDVDEQCENGSKINLLSFVNQTGGTFTGTGIEGNSFIPSKAGAGYHKITYTLGDETCSQIVTKQINVVSVPTIEFNEIPNVCFNETVQLNNYVNQSGTFSGRGVTGNIFDPNDAGVGEHIITFHYQNGKCIKEVATTIQVLSILNPRIEFYPLEPVCVTSEPIDLNTYSNTTGSITGTGVTGNIFYPTDAGAGIHELTLSVGNGTCSRNIRQYITVYAQSILEINSLPKICHGEILDLNKYVNIKGGKFSGEYVKANYFYPERTGDTNITYTYTNSNGCESSITFTLNVGGLYPETVTFTQVEDKCTDNPMIDLRNYVSYYIDENTFSGKGVVGYFFDPAAAGVGVHEVNYTIGSGTCTQTLKKYITVHGKTNVKISMPPTICSNIKIDLNEKVNIVGGTFTGKGVSGNIFDPSVNGTGTYVITYKYTNANGCISENAQTIEVKSLNPSNIVFDKPNDVCLNASIINLKNYVNTSDCRFSGNGVTGYYFDPAKAGEGTHVLTCRIGNDKNCYEEYNQTITVNALPSVVFDNIPEVCFNENIELFDYVDVASGYFFGPGVINNQFNPKIAGTGTHKISYIIQDASGCYKTFTRTIVVKTLFEPNIKFFPLSNMCEKDEAIFLSEYVNSFTGVFTGKGVANFMFNPKVAGPGTHKIDYAVGDGQCIRTFTQYVTVYPQVEIEFNSIAAICKDQTINLYDYVNNPGGNFVGEGIIDGKINTADLAIGQYTIEYQYLEASNGCLTSVSQILSITGHTQNVIFTQPPVMCENGSPIYLTSYVDYAGGTFTGTGVTNALFNPTKASSGIHKITYTIGSGGCVSAFEKYITVYPSLNVEFMELPKVCDGQKIALPDYVSVQGGKFNGMGVIGDTLYTETLSIGEYTITYTFKDSNGCDIVNTQLLKVNGKLPKSVTISPVASLCENAADIYLTDYVNVKTGNFIGTGVKNSVFSPSEAKAGTHKIRYRFENGACTAEYEMFITVYPLRDVKILPISDICNDREIDLNKQVTIPGGTFLGEGISGNILSTSELALGIKTFTYQYVDENGCITNVKSTYNLLSHNLSADNIEYKDYETTCVNSNAIDLTTYVDRTDGVFSGKGVTNSVFNPSIAGTGIHPITYSIGTGSCQIQFTKSIMVLAATNVEFMVLPEICNGEKIALNNYVSIKGGTFSGIGISNDTVYSENMSVGKYTITYNYMDGNGCKITATQTLNINGQLPQNVVLNPIEPMCENSPSIYLTDYTNIKTGNFSGGGVKNSVFSPSEAKAGTHKILYKFENGTCKSQYETFITVYPVYDITFSTLPIVCSSEKIALNDYVNLHGGTFTGPSIVNDTLHTEKLNIDEYLIKYSMVDDNGCNVTTEQILKVKGHLPQEIQFTPIEAMCENGESIYLTDYVNDKTGNFSGEGVKNSVFSPSEAKAGTHRITYKFENAVCTSRFETFITVYPLRNVTFKTIPDICENQKLDLTGYVTVKGGIFSGEGVNQDTINTASLPLGKHLISYSYKDNNGCTSTITTTYNILSHNPPMKTITFKDFDAVCINSSPIDLTKYVNHSGGRFIGDGVTGTVLDPAKAGSGIHLIQYIVGAGTCQVLYSQALEIKNAPNLVFHDFPSLCINNDVINLNNYVSIQGGTFSGPGIEGVLLKRSSLDVGIYSVFYSFDTANGCTINIEKTFTVEQALPENVIFSRPSAICVNGGRVNLYDFVNTNGIFTGNGIEDNGLFNPSVAQVGEHRITFTYGNGQCEKTIYQYINVTAEKTIMFRSLGKVCDTTAINLNEYVNYKGGVFSGKGVKDNMFYPNEAAEGVHQVTYEYTDGLCTVSTIQNIEVLTTGTVQINLDKSSVKSSALVKFWSNGVDIVEYEWKFGDGGYSLEKEPFHYYYHEGSFDVSLQCVDINGCPHTVKNENFITVSSYNGLKSVIMVNDTKAIIGKHYKDEIEGKYDVEFNAYPNPFKDKFTLMVKNYYGMSNIRVTNMTGSTIKQIKFEGTGTDKIKIDLSLESNGIYFIEFEKEVIKVVKQ